MKVTNHLEGESNVPASSQQENSLASDERVALLHTFNNLLFAAQNDVKLKKDGFNNVFTSESVPIFPLLVYSYLENEGGISFETFQSFVVKCCRTSSQNILHTFWDIFQRGVLLFSKTEHGSEISHALNNIYNSITIPMSVRPLILFLLFIHEIGEGNSSCRSKDVKNIFLHICTFYRKKTQTDTPQKSENTIDLNQFSQWVYEYAPNLPRILITYVTKTCLRPKTLPRTSFHPVVFDSPSSIINHNNVSIFPLVLYNQHLQGTWKKLYSTDSDGLSFNRIAHHILGYEGPTCFLISCHLPSTSTITSSSQTHPPQTQQQTQPVIIGFYVEDRWRDSNRFYGSSGTFLFTLSPQINIYRSKSSSNEAYQWLNLKSYGLPHGIGIGGSTEKFRIFIPDSLEQCLAHYTCLTFESGPLLPSVPSTSDDHYSYSKPSSSSSSSTSSTDYSNTPQESMQGSNPNNYQNHHTEFQIEVMEIWACGGDEMIDKGLKGLARDRSNRDELIRQARKVDKAAFADNKFDQEFLLSKTFAHKVKVAEDV